MAVVVVVRMRLVDVEVAGWVVVVVMRAEVD